MNRTPARRSALAALALVAGFAGTLPLRIQAQAPAPAPARPTRTADETKYRPGRPDLSRSGVEVLPVQGSISLIATGTGANVVVLADDQGALLVDTSLASFSDRILAEVRKLTRGPIKGIVNTTTDADHIGGNERLSLAGVPMFAGNAGFGSAPQATIFAHEKALNRLSAPSGATPPVPAALWPTDTFFKDRRKLFFNHEPIELLSVPGHTDGDIMVWFRRSDVIAAGDVFTTESYPRFDAARGGSVQGVLDGLNRIVDIAVAEFNQIGGTRIVPGHGRIANQSDVVEYRDMVTIVRDRVRDAMRAGRTRDQIAAARFTLDYDGVYATPDYSGTMFVQAVYDDLARAGVRPQGPATAVPKTASKAPPKTRK